MGWPSRFRDENLLYIMEIKTDGPISCRANGSLNPLGLQVLHTHRHKHIGTDTLTHTQTHSHSHTHMHAHTTHAQTHTDTHTPTTLP